MEAQPHPVARPDAGVAAGGGLVVTARVLSSLALLAMGGIHAYLVWDGFGGLLGVLFVINAVGGLVLAVAMLVVGRRLLPVTSLLSLVFLLGTLLALVLALTVGLFGIREQLGGELVPTTLVVEAIGVVVLAVTTGLAIRASRATVS